MKCTITIEDTCLEENRVAVECNFEPPLDDKSGSTAASNLVVEFLELFGKHRKAPKRESQP